MTPKARRLEALKALGGSVPETISSLDEFAAVARDPEALWWVRATAERPADRYKLTQGPWTTAQVSALARDAGGDASLAACVVQRYLPPRLSGITYATGVWALTAVIEGPCEPLLREGSPGALFSREGERRWSALSGELPADAEDIVEAVEHTVDALGQGILVEWIATRDEAIHHVDYKNVGHGLLASPFPRGGSFLVGCEEPGAPEELVDSTRIEHLAVSGAPQALRCRSGSPLAHLCVEVGARGGRVIVEAPVALPT
jgi:hypothetical protein